MIYITGSMYGNLPRIKEYEKVLEEDDCLIILGNFGFVWTSEPVGNAVRDLEEEALHFLSKLKFKILFIDGKGDNQKRLENYPSEIRFGGKVGVIRDNIYYLQRGEVFNIEDKKIFVMGGGMTNTSSLDILNPEDEDFEERYEYYARHNLFNNFKILDLNWWGRETPNRFEFDDGIHNLRQSGFKVDYILTHYPPKKIVEEVCGDSYFNNYSKTQEDFVTFLDQLDLLTKYDIWFFSFFKEDKIFEDKFYNVRERLQPL